MLIKRVNCHSCGAPKITRSKTAYVFCDYCGVLTDWDLETALTAPGAVIPFEYERLSEKLAPDVKAAKSAGDRARYYQLQYELFDTYTRLCPAAFSPRVRDPEYREAYVRYTAATCVVQGFDAELPALEEALTATMNHIKWDATGGTMRITPSSFWPMWDAYVACGIRGFDLNDSSGLGARHPDGTPRGLLVRMSYSRFVQGWLPYLEEQEAAKLLAKTGLRGDYVEAEPVALDVRRCGGCGDDLQVAKGATRVVCEACGRLVDVKGVELPCTHCGKPLSWPAGKTMMSCPCCKNELRAMANPYG